MNPDTRLGMSAADRLSSLINECADVIFNIVPVMMYLANTLEVLADLATDDTGGTQSHPHELVTLAEAFRTTVASLLTSRE